jgi:hypothetical protein
MMEETAAGLGGYGFTVLLLIVPVWRIFRRAGFHPALSLLMFLPVIGIPLVALLLAFLRWPAVVRA